MGFAPKTVLVIVTLVAGCIYGCAYRYTKAFHLSDKFPVKRVDQVPLDKLPERFESWFVQVGISSVWNSSDKKAVEANMYYIRLYFRLPRDTSVWWMDSSGVSHYQGPEEMFLEDTSVNVVKVDSLVIQLEETGETLVLLPMHRSIVFGHVHIPEIVHTIRVQFVARLETPEGDMIKSQRFDTEFFRWEHRWNNWLPLE